MQYSMNNSFTILISRLLFHTNLYPSMQINLLGIVGSMNFVRVRERRTFSSYIHFFTSHVIDAQDHVLGRHDDWLTTGGRQNVVRGHHQRTAFQLSFQRQRHVDSHLVAIEVSVIGTAH